MSGYWHWQLGSGTLRYPRYPGDDGKYWVAGYWQLGLGTLRYPWYPGSDGDPRYPSGDGGKS